MKKVQKVFVNLVVLSLMATSSVMADKMEGKKMPLLKADIYIVPKPVDLAIDLKYPAQVKAYQSVKAYSRVLGVLEQKHFTEGEKVKKGDLLFTIEDDIYKAKVEAAAANVKMNEASLEYAKRDWERIKKLFQKKAVSAEKRDEALFAYEEALSGMAMAKAELAQAQVDYDYTKVKAPIAGIAGIKQVDIGDLVTQNPPTELVSITQNDQVYLDFSVPLSDYKNVKSGLWTVSEDGLIVEIINNGKTMTQKGKVDFIDVNIDKATSTVKMRAIVENKDNALMAGDFIRVVVKGISQKGVITIPQRAMLQNPMGTIVFVEENGVAAVRPVVVGKESGDKYVVLGGALQSGDRVIVNNFFKVKPGQPLQVDKIINQ